ncbi:MAG: hypothetical protein HY877_09350, partial [Deltaproteobacteria bacterium]|nr:hypothetical protein [Deltaproteobacteria bacterium]
LYFDLVFSGGDTDIEFLLYLFEVGILNAENFRDQMAFFQYQFFGYEAIGVFTHLDGLQACQGSVG